MYDAIVIGAGPAGIMATITAAKNNKKILLIEKKETIGKKLILTGGGRCNITNFKDTNDFISSLPVKNGRFLYSCLSNFNSYDIYYFLESIGVPLKIENDDKVFPESDKAKDIISAFEKELTDNNAEVLTDTQVLGIENKDDVFIIKTDKENFQSKKLIIATGGRSYPHTGSTGEGYQFAKKFGHSLATLFPTESPILSSDPLIANKELQGISLQDVTISLVRDKKVIKEHTHDLIFTHFGLSGPAALKLSQFVYHEIKQNKQAKVLIDLLPSITIDDLVNQIKKLKDENLNKSIKNALSGILQNRLLIVILKYLNIDPENKINSLSNELILKLSKTIKGLEINVTGVKPIEHAFVTGGGINLNEVNPKTMESKIINGLYFAGEILDLHGYTGGYNITIALSTGYNAGNNI